MQGGRGGAFNALPPGAAGLILGGALLGALLLVVAEFTTLYTVHSAVVSRPLPSAQTGSHHSYAMLPIALVAGLLALSVRGGGGRLAILALGVLGLTALLIALLNDLPDARHAGLVGSAARGYVSAAAHPSAGLYMETLGGVILIATCGSGLLLAGRPAAPR